MDRVRLSCPTLITTEGDQPDGETIVDYKAEFIEFMVRSEVLKFGDFVTKSGRRTPYFLDTGRYCTGEQLARLGDYYSWAIRNNWLDGFDLLFGPAYKGIPLVTTTAIALARHDHGRSVRWCFNRKEVKDHGEGGLLVGAQPHDGDRVLIVEDVTTAGTSIRETVPTLRAIAEVEIVGLVVSVDRKERGLAEGSALSEVADEFDMPVHAIVDVDEIVGYLHGREIDGRVPLNDDVAAQMIAYRQTYGAHRVG